ncbi:MAG TPA: hypothetical protein VF528_03735 [Pyrinomonadaceae bacterium]|jgi:hypothetical protein
MSIEEQVTNELKTLSEAQLKEVADYLAFLKFRARHQPTTIDETHLAALYAEFAEEDRRLAEEGIADYAEDLAEEDGR